PDAKKVILPLIRRVLILLGALVPTALSATAVLAVPLVSPACLALDGDSGSLTANVDEPLWSGDKQFWIGDVLTVTFNFSFGQLGGTFNPNWNGGSSGINPSINFGPPVEYHAGFD